MKKRIPNFDDFKSTDATNEFSWDTSIKPFKMEFTESMDKSKDFKIVMDTLTNLGHDLTEYNKSDKCLIYFGAYFQTVPASDFFKDEYKDIPELTFKEFAKKYKRYIKK